MPIRQATTFLQPAAPKDRAAWEPMWRAYCRFYETDISDEVTDHTWSMIVGAASPVGCLLGGAVDGPIAGFATFVIHPYTWSTSPACYLEDLFVDPEARGKGVGRALIQGVRDEAVRRGCTRLYWMTRESNVTARKLYDAVAKKDDFVRYVVPLSSPG
jgi:GNAT superfamily N-acetyltransferase